MGGAREGGKGAGGKGGGGVERMGEGGKERAKSREGEERIWKVRVCDPMAIAVGAGAGEGEGEGEGEG